MLKHRPRVSTRMAGFTLCCIAVDDLTADHSEPTTLKQKKKKTQKKYIESQINIHLTFGETF